MVDWLPVLILINLVLFGELFNRISFTISDTGSYMGGDFTVRAGASWAEFLKTYTKISANSDGSIMSEGDQYLYTSSGTQVNIRDQIIANETYSWT